MKGFKAVNMTKVLSDLQTLKEVQRQNNQALSIIIDVRKDGTLDANAVFSNGKKYWNKSKNVESIDDVFKMFPDIKEKAPVILDDMILQTDMYLPTDIILYKGKETIRKFINLALNHNEEEYMKAYIELFDKEFGISEPDFEHWIKGIGEYDYRYNNVEEQEKYNNWLKNKYQESFDAVKNLLAEHDSTLADFFENYKKLSIEELVERYKDKRFFKPKL